MMKPSPPACVFSSRVYTPSSIIPPPPPPSLQQQQPQVPFVMYSPLSGALHSSSAILGQQRDIAGSVSNALVTSSHNPQQLQLGPPSFPSGPIIFNPHPPPSNGPAFCHHQPPPPYATPRPVNRLPQWRSSSSSSPSMLLAATPCSGNNGSSSLLPDPPALSLSSDKLTATLANSSNALPAGPCASVGGPSSGQSGAITTASSSPHPLDPSVVAITLNPPSSPAAPTRVLPFASLDSTASAPSQPLQSSRTHHSSSILALPEMSPNAILPACAVTKASSPTLFASRFPSNIINLKSATASAFAEPPGMSSSSRRDRYKMSLCNFFYKGRCRNGSSCRFAHGIAELRGPLPTKHKHAVDSSSSSSSSSSPLASSSSSRAAGDKRNRSRGADPHSETGSGQLTTTRRTAATSPSGKVAQSRTMPSAAETSSQSLHSPEVPPPLPDTPAATSRVSPLPDYDSLVCSLLSCYSKEGGGSSPIPRTPVAAVGALPLFTVPEEQHAASSNFDGTNASMLKDALSILARSPSSSSQKLSVVLSPSSLPEQTTAPASPAPPPPTPTPFTTDLSPEQEKISGSKSPAAASIGSTSNRFLKEEGLSIVTPPRHLPTSTSLEVPLLSSSGDSTHPHSPSSTIFSCTPRYSPCLTARTPTSTLSPVASACAAELHDSLSFFHDLRVDELLTLYKLLCPSAVVGVESGAPKEDAAAGAERRLSRRSTEKGKGGPFFPSPKRRPTSEARVERSMEGKGLSPLNAGKDPFASGEEDEDERGSPAVYGRVCSLPPNATPTNSPLSRNNSGLKKFPSFASQGSMNFRDAAAANSALQEECGSKKPCYEMPPPSVLTEAVNTQMMLDLIAASLQVLVHKDA